MNMNQYADMRDAIFEEIYGLAQKDKKIIILSADNGAAIFKKFQENIPAQFYNVGIAEQNAMSVAAGLALTGRRVFVVGIANFVTLRCFEQIRNDIAMMNLPVTILASGTGYFYGEDGPTHHMTDNLTIMRTLPNFTFWCPSSFQMAASLIHEAYKEKGPNCIWFDRGPFYPLGEHYDEDFSKGVNVIKSGHDAIIVSFGIMVGEAFKISAALKKFDIDVGVIDLYRLKPLNKSLLLEAFKKTKRIVTLEEHTVSGGLGAVVCEFLSESDLLLPVKMFGIQGIFRHEVGSRDFLRRLDGLDVQSVAEKIRSWLK